MRVFAIDTALEACSAALLDTERGAMVASETKPMPRGHAEALMPMIKRVLDDARIDVATIDRIAVTVGPGSFTGLRVGIAAARGMALAMARPAVGLSTLASYAAPLIAQDDTLPVLAVIDARHDHVYMQLFGANGRTLVAPRLATIAEALRAASTGGTTLRIAGNAAKLLTSAWPAGTAKPTVIEQHHAPDIAWVAQLGAAALEKGEPPKPLYLRAPSAQPQPLVQIARR